MLEDLELRCSMCRAVVSACSVCGGELGAGVARCTRRDDGKHHHERCDDERRRRLWMRDRATGRANETNFDVDDV